MFEEKSEDYRKYLKSKFKFFLSEPQFDLACQGFKDGYNKANKWHYIKNGDLPKKYANADDRKLFLLVLLKHDDHGKNFFAWVLSYYDFHKKEWLIDYGMGEPYAWYELPERPKLPEEKND